VVPAGLRVLLVEDDAEVREVVRSFLDSFGCRVTSCASAEEALALEAPEPGHDLLLSDIMLGAGMRGTELAPRAVARWPGLAVLLLSGYATELVEAGGPRRGTWPSLRKPFSREQLARAVVRALRGG
jgi:CheY-like chemotaxis protein